MFLFPSHCHYPILYNLKLPSNQVVFTEHVPIVLLVIFHMFTYLHYCALSMTTSSTAQGGGGSFKNRKPIGEVGCCESGMAERVHWWTERCLRSPLFCSLSLTIYLPTYLSSMYLSIYRSISLSLFHLSICLAVYLYILTWKCASRHSGVHFFDIRTSKSGANMWCFVHFDLEMCFAPQRRALFQHPNL